MTQTIHAERSRPKVSIIGGHASPSASAKRRVTRCLFGRPDRDEQRAWLRDQLSDMYEQSKSKWNFDFVADMPITTSSSANSSNDYDSPDSSVNEWEWTPVNVSSMPSPYQPVTYRSPPPGVLADTSHRLAAAETSQPADKSPTTAGSSAMSPKDVVVLRRTTRTSNDNSSPKITGYFPSRKRLRSTAKTDGIGGTPKSSHGDIGVASKVSRVNLTAVFASSSAPIDGGGDNNLMLP